MSRNSLFVVAALVCLFTATGFLAKGWRAARQERAEHHFARGQALEKAGKYAAAEEEYREALAFAHAAPRYRMALAVALVKLEDWNEAEAHLRELQAADPAGGEVNLMLARIAARQGERAEAEEDYRRAAFGYWPEQAAANRIQARFELVDLLAKYGERKKLLSELLELASEAPDDAQVKTRIGSLLLEYGSAAHAAEVLGEAVAANAHYAPAWLELGRALMTRGEFQRAQAALRNAVKEAPSSAEARALLAQAEGAGRLDPTQLHLSAAERYRRSRELLGQVLDALERCAVSVEAADEAHALLGARRKREGDTPKALELAQRLWRERQAACGARNDAVLAAVMARLER